MASPSGARVGGTRSGNGMTIKMTENTLTKGIKTLPGVVNRAAAFALQKNAAPAENWMKSNAPWTDRTTNARNGLSARYAGSSGGVHVMVLFHTVDYGIWLEVAHEGRYRIIDPALQEWGPRVMKDLIHILDRIHEV